MHPPLFRHIRLCLDPLAPCPLVPVPASEGQAALPIGSQCALDSLVQPHELVAAYSSSTEQRGALVDARLEAAHQMKADSNGTPSPTPRPTPSPSFSLSPERRAASCWWMFCTSLWAQLD